MSRLFLFCLATLLSLTTWAQTIEYGGLKYSVVSTSGDSGTVEVTYSGTDKTAATTYAGDIDIPGTFSYEGVTYTVTSIGDYSFYSSGENITSITIPNTVTYIGAYAFMGCTGFTALTIPGSVLSIGTQAFDGCVGIKELILEEGDLEELAMETTVQKNTFSNCEIETLYLGRVLVCSSENFPTFREMKTLTSITISEKLTHLHNNAFYGCSGLTKIKIPDQFTEVASFAFYECVNLAEVDMPETITTIESFAFCDCESLTSFLFPRDLTTLGNGAFRRCSGIKGELVVPSRITSIGEYAFADCTGLISVKYESDDAPVNRYTFRGCSALEDITLPSGITAICEAVFLDCISLESITIPANVASLDLKAFNGCTRLKNVYFENPEGITTFDNYVFAECEALEEFDLPINLTTLGTYTFEGCISLKRATVPEGLTLLSKSTFAECTALTDVSLPESLTEISANVFENCTSLKELTIPENVEHVYGGTFNGCSALEKIFSYPVTPPLTASDTFKNSPTDTCVLIVPTGSKPGYSQTQYWSLFKNIMEVTPIVSDVEVIDVSWTCATLHAYYEDGYNETIEKGFEYWTTEDNVKIVVVEEDEMEVEVTGLTTGTTYTYRAYAKTEDTTIYSDTDTFTTLDLDVSYEVDPEEGGVESIKVITFTTDTWTLGNYDDYAFYIGTVSVYKDDSNEPCATTKDIDGVWGYEGGPHQLGFTITFANKITESGKYAVVIPAGLFYWYNNNNPVLNEEITLYYSIEGSEDPDIPEGIGSIYTNSDQMDGHYNISGQKIDTLVKGVNIVRYSDGTTKKILIK